MNRLLNNSQVAEIEKIIQNYHPNSSVLSQFRGSNFAVIAGPAAAGKDTLRNALAANDDYVNILSTTTRPRRTGELEGKTYNFTDYAKIKKGLIEGRYFQAALVHKQQVSVLDVDEIHKLQGGKIGLSILIVQVEKILRQIKPDIKTIFLVPPNFQEMKQRLNETRSLSEAEIKRRLEAAKQELEYAIYDKNYYFIVSEGYSRVEKLADAFLKTGQKDGALDSQAREKASSLLSELVKQNDYMID